MRSVAVLCAIASCAIAVPGQAQQAQVTVFGATQPPAVEQESGAVRVASTDFNLYDLNARLAAEQLGRPSLAPGTPASAVLPVMEAEMAALASSAPATSGVAAVPAVASRLAGCAGLALAPPVRLISAAAHASRRIYYSLVREAECRYNLPSGLMDSVIIQESRYQPRAVSRAGAGGLSQLMPGTARDLGVANRFDPRENVNGGARYLRKMLDQFGSVPLALAAYNAGPASVMRARGIPRNGETPDYVRNVLRFWSGVPGTAVDAVSGPVGLARRLAVTLGFATS